MGRSCGRRPGGLSEVPTYRTPIHARRSSRKCGPRRCARSTWRCFLIGPYCRFAADKRDANRTGMVRHVTRRVPVRLASETTILKLEGYAARNKSVPASVLSEKRVKNGSGSRMGRCPMGYSLGAVRPPTTTPCSWYGRSSKRRHNLAVFVRFSLLPPG